MLKVRITDDVYLPCTKSASCTHVSALLHALVSMTACEVVSHASFMTCSLVNECVVNSVCHV